MRRLICIECGDIASSIEEVGSSMLCAQCERSGMIEAPIRYAAALACEEIEADRDIWARALGEVADGE